MSHARYVTRMHFMFLILAFMLWGRAAFKIVVAAGGLARDLLAFPLSRRSPT